MLLATAPMRGQETDIYSDTWTATDALGRTMPTVAEAPLRTDKQRTVGISFTSL